MHRPRLGRATGESGHRASRRATAPGRASQGRRPAALYLRTYFNGFLGLVEVGRPRRGATETADCRMRDGGECNNQCVPRGTNRQSIYTAKTPTYALRVPVHFCYSCPHRRHAVRLSSPDGRVRSSLLAPIHPAGMSWITTIPSSWAAPPLSSVFVPPSIPRYQGGPAAPRSAAPPSPSRTPRAPS